MSSRDPEFCVDDDLKETLQRLEIYEALAIALRDPHGTLDVLMDSPDPDAACEALRERHGFSQTQAVAVLEVQLRLVTAIDRQRIEEQRQELVARAVALETLLDG